jgi:hypothetical protein
MLIHVSIGVEVEHIIVINHTLIVTMNYNKHMRSHQLELMN